MSIKPATSNILIILTSDEVWGDVWMPQLVYAYELSKKYKVVYINPPEAWSIKNMFLKGKPTFSYNKNLRIFQYHNIFPVRLFSNLMIQLNDFFNSSRLKKEIGNGKENIITWQFDTHRFRSFTGIAASKKIYHVIDPYMGVAYDEILATSADLVVSTSPKYVAHYSKYNKNVMMIPHGNSREDQIPDKEKVSALNKEFGNYILCLGTISSHSNMDILEKVADECPEHFLVVVGPVKIRDNETETRFNEFIKRKNVKFLGPKHGLQLKNYVAASSVCIVPYKDLVALNTNRSPMRILNYISQYKVVINSVDSEISELENKIIYTSGDPGKFAALVRQGLENKLLIDKQVVDNYLDKIEYGSLIDSIILNLN